MPHILECGAVNVLVAARYGHMLVNRHDVYIGRSIMELGEYSEAEVDLLRHFVRPGALVLEAGANIGAHTLPLAQMVGPKGHLWAFEPQRIVFQTLCANLALNSVLNVTAVWAALGNHAGHVFIPGIDYTCENNFGGLGLEGRTKGESVQLISIDALALPRLDLLKADVEGMEQAVLEGARETLQRCRPVLYVENDRAEKSLELIGAIKQLGYVAYSHIPRMYSEKNFFGQSNNPFGNIASSNILAIHQSVPAIIQGLPQL